MTKAIQVISFESNGVHCLFLVTALLEWLPPSFSGMITRPRWPKSVKLDCLNVIKVTKWPITQLAWLRKCRLTRWWTGGTKRREDKRRTQTCSQQHLPICMEFILIIIRHEQIFEEGNYSSKTKTDSTGLCAHKQNYVHILGKRYGCCVMNGNLIRQLPQLFSNQSTGLTALVYSSQSGKTALWALGM